eukprot:c7414_g1_i1 orf=208-1935(+)
MASRGIPGRPRNAPPSRLSMASAGRPSMSRRSSVAYGKGSQPRADPRPINDKGFQTASMRRLVEYLTTHGYNFPISPKLLPSGKDIHNMIEFLFRQVDPTYRLIKLEDDVPLFFRMLGYPFQISKSALYAAGSPHSWPNLLAALAWLVDLYNCHEKEAEAKAQNENASDQISDYLAQSYAFFLQGDDDSCSALDEQMQAQSAEVSEEARRHAEQLAQQIVELDSKLQALKSEPSPLVALETKKSMLLSDVGKFNALIQNLTSHKASLEKRVEQHKQQLDAKKAELGMIAVENQALSHRVSEQTVNVEDFGKMTRDLQRIEEDLQSAMALRKEKEKETWDLEVLASKKLKKLESVALECNHGLKRLKLPNPDNSSGNPFEIHLNLRGETAQDLIGIDIKQLVRPHLVALLEDTEKSVREKWKESTDLLKEISAKEDGLQEKQVMNSQLELKMKELEAVCKKRQEMLESIQSSISKIRTRAEEEEEKLKALEFESAERYERAKKEHEQLEVVSEQELQQETSKLLAVFEGVAGHVEESHAKHIALKADVDKLKEMVSNNYIRRLKHLQFSGSEDETQ